MNDWQLIVAPATLLIGFIALVTFLRSGLNRIEDKMDARFDKVDARFDRLEEIARGHGERILVLEVARGIPSAQIARARLPERPGTTD